MTDCGWIVRALLWIALGGSLGILFGVAIGYALARGEKE